MLINPAMPKSGHYMHKELVITIQDCEATCEHMINHITKMMQEPRRINQVLLLRDCANICGLTAKFVARNAIFSKYAASLCADICGACGNECARFKDKMSQECSMICLHCERQCSAFANMDMDMNMNKNMNMNMNR